MVQEEGHKRSLKEATGHNSSESKSNQTNLTLRDSEISNISTFIPSFTANFCLSRKNFQQLSYFPPRILPSKWLILDEI